MDVIILISIAIGLIILIISLTLFSRRSGKKLEGTGNEPVARGQPVRRAAGVRNARRRMQGTGGRVEAAASRNDASNEEDNAEEDSKVELPEQGKIGTKKRAKLEAKAEKKQQREAMEKDREDRKKREQLLQEEADRQREREKAEELKQQEAEKKLREEKEKQEYEEYLKMKEAFSVEEEGFDQNEVDEENLLHKFLEYIKYNKVVILEDLAAHFNLKTANVIERIQELQATGRLSGVIDDRGKFIYISQEELEAVAKFVKQRGRVSISELAENSNRLISLSPGNPSKTVEAN